jgi:hypothetical protein
MHERCSFGRNDYKLFVYSDTAVSTEVFPADTNPAYSARHRLCVDFMPQTVQ